MSKSRRTSDLVNSLLVNADNSVNIHEGTQSPYFQLDTAATPTLQPGMFGWNDAYGTADLRLKGGNVTLQLGQETLARVVNKTGADLLESDYKVVRVRIASEGGAQGQRLAVVLAQGNNDPDSVTTLGLVTENIANNQEGFITIFGNVNGINTTGSLQGETWVDGDVLYLSPTTPGGLTKVKPTAPDHTVTVGYVVYAHANQGKIFVKVDNGYELDELHNVKITSVANNDLLQYDSTQQVWKNVAASVAVPTPTLAQVTTAGNTTTNAITVGGLTVATNLIYTDLVNSRVFIGDTTSPQVAKLTIKGNDNSGSGLGFVIYNTSTATNSYSAFKLYAGNGAAEGQFYVDGLGGSMVVRTYTNHPMIFGTNQTERLRIFANGNIGINTTTDAGYKLDVNGSAAVRSGLTLFGETYLTQDGITAKFSSKLGIFQFDRWQSGPVTAMYINGWGNYTYLNTALNLGTNSTTVESMLSVYGSRTAASAIARGVYFNNTLVAAANNDVLVGLDINPTFTNGAFTGVTNYAVRVTGRQLLKATVDGFESIKLQNFADTYFNTISFYKSNGTSQTVVLGDNGASVAYPFMTGMLANYGFVGNKNSGFHIFAGSNITQTIHTNGNFTIGTTTDAGYKLDVNGTARVQGSLNISATAAFTIGTIQALARNTNDLMVGFDNSTLTFYTGNNPLARFYSNGNFSVGSIVNSGAKFQVTGSITAATALAQGVYFNNTLVAAANNDVLVGLDINPTFTNGAFTGVTNYAVRVTGKQLIKSSGDVITIDSTTLGSRATLKLISDAASYTQLVGNGTEFNMTTLGTTPLTFGTNSAERMRIFGSTGNIGINTTTDAGYKLDVNGSLRVVSTGWIRGHQFSEAGNVHTYQVGYGAYGQFELKTANGAQFVLRATETGRIGIGTTTPNYILDVYQTNVKAQIRSTGENQNATLFLGTPFGGTSSPKVAIIARAKTSWSRADLAFCLNDNQSSNSVEATISDLRMVILSDGKVGVNVANPTYQFQVSGDIALSGNLVPTAGSQTLGTFTNRFGDVWAGGLIVGSTFYGDNHQSASGTLYFKDGGGVEKMRMTSVGNFLIGTTTDTGEKLQVNGTVRASAFAIGATAGWTGTINIPTNPPGQQNIDVQGGIIVNVF